MSETLDEQATCPFDGWLKAELDAVGVKVELPPVPTPGGLAILVPYSQSDLFKSFANSLNYRLWEVRGVLVKPAWPCKVPNFLRAIKPGLRMSTTGTGGSEAFVNFQFRLDDQGGVEQICARVEETTPIAALGRARQPLEQLLDELCSLTFSSMRFAQFDVAVSHDSPVLATETFLPFGPNLEIDSHVHLPPARAWLDVMNELFREALCATSPYYRLLVAFRIVEGISTLKKLIVDVCRKKNITTSLPRNPHVSKSEIRDRGATIDSSSRGRGNHFRCKSCTRLGETNEMQ